MTMFKQFIERIIAATDREDAIENVFYGTTWADGKIIQWGVDIAYQHDKITWKEHQMLLALIEKLPTRVAPTPINEVVQTNAEADDDAYVAEIMRQKKELGIECPPIDSFTVVWHS